MAWESGYTKDHVDLLVRLKEALTGYPLITNPVHSNTGLLYGIHTTLSTPIENWTVSCTNDLVPATFSVVGSISGAQSDAVVGTEYDNSIIRFTLVAGSTPFVVGDSFTFSVKANDLVASSQTWSVNRFTGNGAQPKAYTSSTFYDTANQARAAFDGSDDTFWQTSDGFPNSSWLAVEYTKPIEVTKVLIRPGNSPLPLTGVTTTRAPKDFTIDYSDNNTTWTTALAVTNQTNWTVTDTRQFLITSSPGAHKYWRIFVSANNGDLNNTAIARFSMYDANGLTDVARYGDGPELVVTGPGTYGGDDVIAAVRSFSSVEFDIFNWQVKGLLGFSSGLSFWEQSFDSDAGFDCSPEVCLYKDPFKYWIVASGRRFIVMAKVFNNSEGCYVGLFLPYATPNQYPYPFLVGGSNANPLEYHTHREGVNSGHRMFVNPGHDTSTDAVGSTARVYLPDNVWKRGSNYETHLYNGSEYSLDRDVTSIKFTPYQTHIARTYDHPSYESYIDFQPDGKVPLSAIQLVDTLSGDTLGELDGVRCAHGVAQTIEDITNDTVDDWVVFNNIYRPEYFAVRLK